MNVLTEAISVVIPIPVLDAKYPGGSTQYERDSPNATYCSDEHLTRVGFMAPRDVEAFVHRLEALGFVHMRDGEAADLVVVDQHQGPTCRCRWARGGKHPDGYSAVWLEGTIPGRLAHPKGWRIGQSSALLFTPNEEAPERFFRLAREEGMDTVLDLKTGKQQYIGRVSPPDEDGPDDPTA